MRRIIALLLTVVMALSLVVVAGAAETGKTVNLRIEPAMKDEEAKDKTELTYYVYLEPQDDAEVGAAQFTLTAPAGASFKDFVINDKYVYNNSGTGFGNENGIFALGMMTDGTSGEIGGYIEDSTFKAVLAGTVRGERMLTAGNSEKWLYEVTLTVPKFDGNTNYTIGVKDATAGYNGDNKETGSVNDLTMRHTVKVSSTGYGGILGDVDMSGEIDVFDVLLAYDYVLGDAIPTGTEKMLADVDASGEIDVFDVLLIYDYVLGDITEF